MHNVCDVRQIVHTAEPLVPGRSRLEVEISIAELKKYKLPGSGRTNSIRKQNITVCVPQTH
jgi:hypothetical protein